MKKVLAMLVVSSLLGTGNMVFAEEFGEEEVGVEIKSLDEIFLEDRTVVIDDTVYKLSLGLVISGDQVSNTEFALKKGRLVKFELDPNSLNQDVRTISRIEFVDE